MTLILATKMEAARRQLLTAIQLWFDDADAVSIHTLAFAAHQIIHDLNRQAKGHPMLLDTPHISPEMKGPFIAAVKAEANFFKHADGRIKQSGKEPVSIELDPVFTELILLMTLGALPDLGESLADEEVAFMTWQRIQRPELFAPAWSQQIQASSGTEAALHGLVRLGKQKFKERLLLVAAKVRSSNAV